MPTRKSKKTMKRRVPKQRAMTKKEMQGEGIFDVLKGLNKLIKKSKIVSTVAEVGDIVGVPHAGKVKRIAKLGGYGLRPGGSSGGGLRPGGARSRGGAKKKRKTPVRRRRKAPVRRKR